MSRRRSANWLLGLLGTRGVVVDAAIVRDVGVERQSQTAVTVLDLARPLLRIVPVEDPLRWPGVVRGRTCR